MEWRLAQSLVVAWMGAVLTGAAAAAPAAEWKLDNDGFGPFRIGMRFEQARSIAPTLALPPPAMGPSIDCKQVSLPDAPGVWLMFVDGVLRRVDVDQPGVRTSHGVTPGAPVARVEQAYADLTRVRYGIADRSLLLTAGPAHGRAIRFEAEDGKVKRMYAGDWTEVRYSQGCD